MIILSFAINKQFIEIYWEIWSKTTQELNAEQQQSLFSAKSIFFKKADFGIMSFFL